MMKNEVVRKTRVYLRVPGEPDVEITDTGVLEVMLGSKKRCLPDDIK